MVLKTDLKNLANAFSLQSTKIQQNYLLCTKEEIILRNFLGGCPDPVYISYGNKKTNNRTDALIKFSKTKDFKEYCKKPQACVINRKELRTEISLAQKISDSDLKSKTLTLYTKIKNKLNKQEKLVLIWKPSKKEKTLFKEILLHELIHLLLEKNNLRLKSWKWNE